MNKSLIVCMLTIAFALGKLSAQDTTYIRSVVNELASPGMMGRGYVDKGDLKAAKYIKSELVKIGVEPFGEDYFQNFNFPMNSFPGNMEVAIDEQTLNPVSEYVVSPNCPTVKGNYQLAYIPNEAETDSLLRDSLSTLDYSGKVLVLNFKRLSLKKFDAFNAEGFVLTRQRSMWWASTAKSVVDKPVILIMDSLIAKPERISLDIENKFYKEYKSQNVLAMIPGSEKPDSIMVFAAHYDHLGLMGKGNVFQGANDNASGTAALLGLAKHFSKPENKPNYSIAFMFFAAEERGLLGSNNYVDKPVVPLTQIKSLINLDMVGTGSKGFAVVNGEDNSEIVNRLKEINEEGQFFDTINVRANRCNSDHCPFAKKNVPAIFIYTMGDEFSEYHNLKDVPEKLPLCKMWELQRMLIDYCKSPN